MTRRYTMRRQVTFRLPAGSQPGEITIRHDGRIVAQALIAPEAAFELPGDSAYEVELRRDGQATPTTRSVKLSLEANQVVSLTP